MNIEVAPPYRHTPLFPLGEDRTTYRKLDCGGVTVSNTILCSMGWAGRGNGKTAPPREQI